MPDVATKVMKIVTVVVFWNIALVVGWSCPNSTRLEYIISTASYDMNPFWRNPGPAQMSNTLDGEYLFAVEGGPNGDPQNQLPASGSIACDLNSRFPSWKLPYASTGTGADTAVKMACDRSRETISVSKQMPYQKMYIFYTASRIIDSTASVSIVLNFQNSSGPQFSVPSNFTVRDWRPPNPPDPIPDVAVRARAQSRSSGTIDTSRYVYIYGSLIDLSEYHCGNVSCGSISLRSIELRASSSISSCSFFLFSIIAERDYDLPLPAPSAPSAGRPPARGRNMGALTPDDIYALGTAPVLFASGENAKSGTSGSSDTSGQPSWVVPYAVTFSMSILLVLVFGAALTIWKRYKTGEQSTSGEADSTTETEMN